MNDFKFVPPPPKMQDVRVSNLKTRKMVQFWSISGQFWSKFLVAQKKSDMGGFFGAVQIIFR